jgi:dienelactone hydrolase
MTDHPLFVPTSEGPVGGIVSEPHGEPRVGLVLLPGAGRPARSGTNSFWTRISRDLSKRGLIVLRVDYSREGETLPIGEDGRGLAWKREYDYLLLEQVLPWFSERLGGLEAHLAGSCSGARGAIELAGRNPGMVGRTFLITPHLRVMEEGADVDAVAPLVVECFRTILERAPSWILIGEHDRSNVGALQRSLGATPHPLEVEVVDGVGLHMLDQPALQAEAGRRLVERVCGTLAPSAARG